MPFLLCTPQIKRYQLELAIKNNEGHHYNYLDMR